MKLHLPKQLFTALLAALTLAAAPAALTLGSAAWGAASFTTSTEGEGENEITTATYSDAANDMQFSEIGSDVDKVILNTSGGWLGNTTLDADVLVQIGADGNDGTTGLVLSDGGNAIYTIANKVIGSGLIKKTGNGQNMVLQFTGDVSEYTGNVELNSGYTFTLWFGGEGISAVSSETNGASGTGTITFAQGSGKEHILKYSYAPAADPIYITNEIVTTGAGTSRITIENGADYIFTKSVDVTKLDITAGSLTLRNEVSANTLTMTGSSVLTVEQGAKLTATEIKSDGTADTKRSIFVNEGASVTTGTLWIAYNMGSVDVDGELTVNNELKFATQNTSNSKSLLTGEGSVSAQAINATNYGSYGIDVNTLTVGDGGIAISTNSVLNLAAATTTVSGIVTIDSGSTLNVNSGNVTMNKNLTGEGTLALNSGSSLTLNGERNSIGSFAYAGGTLNYSTLTAGAVNISEKSPLSNSGHLTVTGTLAGSIQNTEAGKVTLSNGMSIAAETSASITGDGITEFGGTLINYGTLTLGGKISLSGNINAADYQVRVAAGETDLYATDRFNTAVNNTAGNGFKLTSGGSYWLVQGGTTGTTILNNVTSLEGYTITQVTGDNKVGDERVGDVYISATYNAGREFYISSGSVNVYADVQGATGYTLQGGTMNIASGSVSASDITCNSSAYTDGVTKGIITVGAGAELLLDTMPGGASLIDLLIGNGMVNAESAGRLVVTTEQSLGANPVTTYKGKLEIVGAKLTIGGGQHNTNKLSSLSEIILNDGGNIFYKGKDDDDASVMDFQKITVESGTGTFHLDDSGGSATSNNTIQFGEIAVAAGASMQLASQWQDSAYYVDKLTGAGEFHAKSATGGGSNKNLTVNNLAGFSGDLVFTGTGFAAVTVNTGGSNVNFRSLSVNDVQGFTFSVQADTTIGLLSATSGTVNVSENKTLTLGGGTAEAQKQHSIGTLSAASAGVTLGDYATLTLGGGTADAQKQHSIGTLSAASAGVTLGDYATLSLSGGTKDAQKQHSIGTLTVANGGKLNLAAYSTLTLGSSHTVTYLVSGAGELVVKDGVILTLANGDNPANEKFDTNVRIKDGGRMVFTGLNYHDQLNYNNGRTVYLEGTAELALGNTRQTVGNWTFDMTGGTISGQGQSNIPYALDFHSTGYIKARAAAGATAETPTVSTVSASIKNRGDGSPLNLVVDEKARLNLTGALSLGGPVKKSGAGLAVISGTVTSLGAVNVTGGTLELQSSASTGSAMSVSSGAKFEISAGTSALSGAVTNDGTFEVSGGSATLSGAVTNNSAITVSGGSATLSGTVTNNGDFAVSGGSATLGGAVTNNGAITVSGGTADFTNTLDMGAGSSLTVSGGSATVSGALNVTGTDVQIGQSDGVLDLAGSFNVGVGASATLSGSVGIAHTITNNGSLTLNASIYLSGDVILEDYKVREAAGELGLYVLDYTDTDTTNSEGNGFKLTSGGSYWLVQGGETDLNGLEKLNGYTVTQETEGDHVGDVYISADYNVGKEFYISSGSVDVDANVQAAATGYTMADTTTMNVTEGSVAAHTITFNGDNTINLAQSAQLYIGQAYGSNTFDHTLTGTGTVVVDRNLAFSGEYLKDFTGTADINSGLLYVGPMPSSSTESGSAASVGASKFIVRDGATLGVNLGEDYRTLGASLDMLTGSTLFNRDGNNILTGNIRFNIVDPSAAEVAYNADGTVHLTQYWPKNITLSGVLSGAGVVEMSAHSTGAAGTASSWVLANNDNTFEGSYNLVDSSINSTTKLVLAKEYAAQYATINLMSSNSSPTAFSHLELQQNATIKGLNSTGAANYVTTTAATATTLTVSEGSFAGILKDGTNATLSLTKTGEGTLTLSGANTYTGDTRTVGGILNLQAGHYGSLILDGADSSNPSINVSGATVDNIEFRYSGSVNFQLAEGQNSTVYTVGEISSTSLDEYTRNLTVGAGVTLNATEILNQWGMGSITVNGILNVDTLDLQASGIEETQNVITGSGVLNVGSLLVANAGTYRFNTAEVNVSDSIELNDSRTTLQIQGGTFISAGSITQSTGTLNVNGGTMNVEGAWNGTGGTVNVNGGELNITGQLNGSGLTMNVASGATLTLGGGTDAVNQVTHNIGTLSAASAGVTLGDYATLTLGGGTAEAQKQHSIGTLTGGTGSTLNLAPHSVLNKVNTIRGTVTLTGSGTYDLGAITTQWLQGNAASILGVTLADDWTGVVKVSGNTSSGDNDVNGARLDDLANENSWVELDSLEGWIYGNSSGGYDHAVNLILSGTGLTINASSQRWYGFSKSIKGTGNFTLATASGDNQSYNFTGDISKWAGAFVVNANGSATPDTTLNLTGGGNLFSGAEGSGVVMNRGGVLNVNIGKADADTTMRGSIGFGEVKTGTLNLTVQGNTEFQKSVEASQMTVNSGKTATFGSTLTANTVNNSGQIQLGKIVTNGEEKEIQVVATVAAATVSKVQMSSTGITGTAQDGSSSISDADIEIAQLAQDASFTIQDMTLTNTSITAASVNIEDSKVSGNVVLNVVKPTEAKDITTPNVGQGVTEGKISFSYGLALVDSNSSLTLNMEVPQAILPSESGLYTLTITLNGFAENFDFSNIDSQVVFGADSWLGKVIGNVTPEVSIVDEQQVAALSDNVGAAATPSVSYTATPSVGTLVITITGLNVPEPTTATLSLLALAALAARRRRK